MNYVRVNPLEYKDVYLCVQAGGRAETASGREVNPDGEICSQEVQALQSC